MAVLVRVSKTTETLEYVEPQGKAFSYSELKNILKGGLPECRFVAYEEVCFVIQHHGINKNLPQNVVASFFYRLLADAPSDEFLYGDVLICKGKEMM